MAETTNPLMALTNMFADINFLGTGAVIFTFIIALIIALLISKNESIYEFTKTTTVSYFVLGAIGLTTNLVAGILLIIIAIFGDD